MRKANHCGKIMLRNDQHPLRMQNHYLKPLPKLLIWAIYGPSMKHSLDNTWIWHSLGNTWIWYGFCFPYQTHTWHCLHSATIKSSLIPIPHDLWTLTMGILHISQCSMQFPCHLGTLVYMWKCCGDLGKFHTIPISSRHASQCDMGMIWSTSIKPPYYHPGISVSDIWMIWLLVHAIY